MTEFRYRFLRVLEYVGTAERLAEQRERRAVKGTQRFGKDLIIFEGILGDTASPVVGQVRLKLCQMLVSADEGEVSLRQPSEYRKGYEDACHELLQLIELNPTLERDNG